MFCSGLGETIKAWTRTEPDGTRTEPDGTRTEPDGTRTEPDGTRTPAKQYNIK